MASSDGSSFSRPVAESLADLLLSSLDATTTHSRFVREATSKGLAHWFETVYADQVTKPIERLRAEHVNKPEGIHAEAGRSRAPVPWSKVPRKLEPFGSPFVVTPSPAADWLTTGAGIEVLGRAGCSRTAEIQKYLDSRQVRYKYVDVDRSPTARLRVQSLVQSGQSTGLLPIVFSNGVFHSLEGSAEANTKILKQMCGS